MNTMDVSVTIEDGWFIVTAEVRGEVIRAMGSTHELALNNLWWAIQRKESRHDRHYKNSVKAIDPQAIYSTTGDRVYCEGITYFWQRYRTIWMGDESRLINDWQEIPETMAKELLYNQVIEAQTVDFREYNQRCPLELGDLGIKWLKELRWKC